MTILPLNLEMGEKADTEHHMVIGDDFAHYMRIDPRRARFPCCIVWTPLPVVSWLIPFIGHVGICREDGVILDFAGPNFVSVDNFAFGAVARYVQINKEKEHFLSSHPSVLSGQEGHEKEAVLTWDNALRQGTQEYQHQAYNLFTCNCHSFVANNLNRLGFCSGGWNVVNLAAFIFVKGRWVSKASIAKSFLPSVIIYSLGLMLGGSSFWTFCAVFTGVLIGWFIIGTYCFRKLIQL